MTEKIINTVKVGFGCTVVIFAASVIRYCLFAPEQIVQIVSLFN